MTNQPKRTSPIVPAILGMMIEMCGGLDQLLEESWWGDCPSCGCEFERYTEDVIWCPRCCKDDEDRLREREEE